MSTQFKDDIEDVIRNQLEASDQLQGFQLYVDVNSGHSSLANVLINEYLKDESPKSPVFVYALNNRNTVEFAEGISEEERTNLQIRQNLIDIN